MHRIDVTFLESIFSREFIDYTLPYIIIVFFIVGIFALLRLSKAPPPTRDLDLGAKLGFMPFNGEPGYILRGEMHNTTILLYLGIAVGRGRGSGDFLMTVGCRVASTSLKNLSVYFKSLIGANRPPGFLPPEIKDVDRWEGHVVRGEPAEIIRTVLSEITDEENVFQEKYGLELMELDNNKLVCNFRAGSYPSQEEIAEIVRGCATLANKINAV
jgi:hypothetical protein